MKGRKSVQSFQTMLKQRVSVNKHHDKSEVFFQMPDFGDHGPIFDVAKLPGLAAKSCPEVTNRGTISISKFYSF